MRPMTNRNARDIQNTDELLLSDTHKQEYKYKMGDLAGYVNDKINYIDSSEKGVANGVATLDENGILEIEQLPNLAITNVITSAQQTLALYISEEWEAGAIQIGDIVQITTTEGTIELWLLCKNDGDEVTDYKKIGASKINWSNILDKPTSSVSNIDDAVAKRHTQNKDTYLDMGGTNEVTVSAIKDTVDKRNLILHGGRASNSAGNNGLGQGVSTNSLGMSEEIAGERTSDIIFTRSDEDEWIPDALIGQLAFSYASGNKSVGVWRRIIANDITTLTVSGTLHATGTAVMTCPVNPFKKNYAHGQGSYAYYGGVFDGQSLWLVPYKSAYLTKVNIQTGAMTNYAHGQGSDAYYGGVFDGQSLWLVPYNSAYLTKVLPPEFGIESVNELGWMSTGFFTTDIQSGTANKDITIPPYVTIENIIVKNTLSSGDITNFQAILDPTGDNVTLLSGKTIANGKSITFKTIADHNYNITSKTLRFNATGNGAGGIEIIVYMMRRE